MCFTPYDLHSEKRVRPFMLFQLVQDRLRDLHTVVFGQLCVHFWESCQEQLLTLCATNDIRAETLALLEDTALESLKYLLKYLVSHPLCSRQVWTYSDFLLRLSGAPYPRLARRRWWLSISLARAQHRVIAALFCFG